MYYYESLVHKNMTWLQHTTPTYGEAFVQLTRETLCNVANLALERVVDRIGKEYPVWIVPVPFYVMPYIYDEQYLHGDNAPELGSRTGSAEGQR